MRPEGCEGARRALGRLAETGSTGAARQRDLIDLCHSSGMRLVGPNCLGVINTAPSVRLNATFAPSFPPAGRIGFLSQSGALGLAVVDHARALGLGRSSFVSNGNKGTSLATISCSTGSRTRRRG